jgi:hypothetical protein
LPDDGASAARARRAAASAVVKIIAEDLLGQAQRSAPVDEGTLRGSGAVKITEKLDGVEAEISFDTPYAARQHEEVTYRHPKGGKAKYLEDPLKAMAPRYLAALRKAVERAL